MIPKTDDIIRKENYRSTALINMGIAILRNVSKPNLKCISRIIYHEQVRFILGMTVFPDEIII